MLRSTAWVVASALAMFGCMTARLEAALVTSNIGVAGTFDTSLTGGGNVVLNGATGTLRQWIPGPFGTGFHTNIGISAGAQTVGLTVPTVNPGTMAASGNVNMTYDNFTPGTPSTINSVGVDLNGGTVIPITVNAAPISISIAGFANANVVLSLNGSITDVDFVSSGVSPVLGGNGGTYNVPGNFLANFQGSVTGTVTNLPLGLANINLGTLTTISPTVITVPGLLPGNVTTTDLDGGVPPFPNDMMATFQAAIVGGIPIPLVIPFNINLTQPNPPNGQSRLIALNASGSINANLSLNNPSYNVSGTVNAALVPEPSSGLLVVASAIVGLGRRRRS